MYLHYFDYFFQKLLKILWFLQIILDISAQQMIMTVILSRMMIYSGMYLNFRTKEYCIYC